MFELFAPLLSNERSENREIPPVACSTPKALYVSMILAAFEEMVGNEQNVRHGRIGSELEKLAAISPFENTFQPLESIACYNNVPSNNFHLLSSLAAS